jgi:hypothetical protein
LTYTINLPPVQWVEVILHFAEVFQGAFELGKRVFDVFIQGEEVAYHFDIFERAGAGRTAYILNQSVGITDGTLTIVLRKSCKWPRLVAFQFIPNGGAFQESS